MAKSAEEVIEEAVPFILNPDVPRDTRLRLLRQALDVARSEGRGDALVDMWRVFNAS